MIFKIVLVVKNLPASTGDIRDVGSILGLGRSAGEGMVTHSSIVAWKIPMDRGAWWVTAHGVAESAATEATERAHKQKAQVRVSFFSAIFTWKSTFHVI